MVVTYCFAFQPGTKVASHSAATARLLDAAVYLGFTLTAPWSSAKTTIAAELKELSPISPSFGAKGGKRGQKGRNKA